MKKYIFMIMIILSAVLFPYSAYAVLTLELSPDTVNFENMASGASGSYRDDIPHQGLDVICSTDQNNAWFLRIRNDQPLTHTSNPAAVIPNAYFKWYGVSTSDLVNTSLVTTRQDFAFEKTVYSGAAAENQTTIKMKFELTVPPNIQSGAYTSNVVFTFTE